MSIYNLQDKAISSSFDELIQIDDNNFLRDGTGSLRQELKTTGSFSASTYFGDGSNLTGIAPAVNTGSLLTTASFDNGTRDLTFSKGDSSTFSVNIPGGSIETGSSMITASNDFSEITFTKGDGSQFTLDTTPRVVHELVKNGSNQTLPKGTPVYASGSVGNAQLIFPALASNDATMPAVYILAQELDSDEEGFGITHGFINGVNTSLFTAGDEVYVGSNGGFTNQRPTGSNLIQKLGTVVRSDNVNGSGVIQIDSIVSVPNIQQGYTWVGDINGVAQPQTTQSIVEHIFTQNNIFTGTQTFDNIAVNGTGSFAYIESVTGSAKIIGDAFIILNNNTPTERYAGVAVQDSGSVGVTASFQFDGLSNDWFYQYSDDGGITTYHGIALFGPEYNTIGNPTYPTTNKLQKGDGGHHLLDSSITDDGTLVTINANVTATGFVGNGLVSGSSQISYTGLTNIPTDIVSGSDQVTSSLDGRYAVLNGSNTFEGNQTVNGSLTQNFAAPAQNDEVVFANVTGASIGGRPYNRVFYGVADYSQFGPVFEDYFAIEYFDSTGYNYGSELNVNGKNISISMTASGSGQGSGVAVVDNYDGTSQVTINSDNKIAITGPTVLSGSLDIQNNLIVNTSSSFNGSVVISGSVQTETRVATITSLTASIDFSDTSLFELELASGVDTRIEATNVGKGQTVNLLITQNYTTAGTVTFSSQFLQPSGSEYVPTDTLEGQDILTLMTYTDTAKIYVVATNKFE